jgi:hypothetical protein
MVAWLARESEQWRAWVDVVMIDENRNSDYVIYPLVGISLFDTDRAGSVLSACHTISLGVREKDDVHTVHCTARYDSCAAW